MILEWLGKALWEEDEVPKQSEDKVDAIIWAFNHDKSIRRNSISSQAKSGWLESDMIDIYSHAISLKTIKLHHL